VHCISTESKAVLEGQKVVQESSKSSFLTTAGAFALVITAMAAQITRRGTIIVPSM
jgi:hypothetical protein